jgi:hypothetical protein
MRDNRVVKMGRMDVGNISWRETTGFVDLLKADIWSRKVTGIKFSSMVTGWLRISSTEIWNRRKRASRER